MIFYYSVTGNTRYAAKFIADKIGCEIIDILNFPENVLHRLRDRKNIGFMFPIYCWGVPPVIKKFIVKIFEKLSVNSYVWAACTCGDEAGIAMKNFDQIFNKYAGRNLDALFSIIMPNTYVLLPGFDVDKPEIETQKLKQAPERLEYIVSQILSQKKIFDVHEGSLATIRTKFIFPIFEKWGVFPKLWKVSDQCISCEKCSLICPSKNITLTEGKPSWGNNCFSCCGCFHICPVKAINYGIITRNKSQYMCPI